MSNIRTANKRHKRAIVVQLGRSKAAKKTQGANVKPVKDVHPS